MEALQYQVSAEVLSSYLVKEGEPHDVHSGWHLIQETEHIPIQSRRYIDEDNISDRFHRAERTGKDNLN